MPRPALLPTIDWPAVFATSLTWEAWLERAEKSEHRQALTQSRDDLILEAETAARIHGLPKKVHVLAIAESWCGDVRRHVPALQKLSEAGDRVEVRYAGRAEILHLFPRYLTNGGEAIPKFVFLSDRFIETGHWGPMSKTARRLISRGRAAQLYPEARKQVAERYAADPGRREEIGEILEEIEIAASVGL